MFIKLYSPVRAYRNPNSWRGIQPTLVTRFDGSDGGRSRRIRNADCRHSTGHGEPGRRWQRTGPCDSPLAPALLAGRRHGLLVVHPEPPGFRKQFSIFGPGFPLTDSILADTELLCQFRLGQASLSTCHFSPLGQLSACGGINRNDLMPVSFGVHHR